LVLLKIAFFLDCYRWME